ncbi:MAG: DMT family transporter [Candidatus Methanofastidiosum sp.]|nr:DMT family transporter [Methanofastidiosum sp.]
MGRFDFIQLSKFESRSSLALAIYLILSASSYPAIRAALQFYHPPHLILLRFISASSILLIYAIIKKTPLPKKKDIPAIIALGFVGLVLNQLFVSFGEVTIKAGTASLIGSLSPIFTAIFATFILKEKLEKIGWIGIFISFFGVALIAFKTGGGFTIAPGAIFLVLAAISNGVYYVFQKPFFKKYPSQDIATYAIWSGTLFLLFFLPNLISDIKAAPITSTISVVYLGVFPLAIGNIFWSYVISKMHVSIAASFISLIPILSIIIAWIWLGEFPALLTLIGGGFAILGTILVDTEGKYPHFKH